MLYAVFDASGTFGHVLKPLKTHLIFICVSPCRVFLMSFSRRTMSTLLTFTSGALFCSSKPYVFKLILRYSSMSLYAFAKRQRKSLHVFGAPYNKSAIFGAPKAQTKICPTVIRIIMSITAQLRC